MTTVRFGALALFCWATSQIISAPTVAQSVARSYQDAARQDAPHHDARLKVLGQHLARECVTCHRLDGVDNGIPSIVGWKIEDFLDTMSFYRDGQRPNQAMMSVAQSLDDEQTKALAIWFALQPQSPKKAPAASQPKKK